MLSAVQNPPLRGFGEEWPKNDHLAPRSDFLDERLLGVIAAPFLTPNKKAMCFRGNRRQYFRNALLFFGAQLRGILNAKDSLPAKKGDRLKRLDNLLNRICF